MSTRRMSARRMSARMKNQPKSKVHPGVLFFSPTAKRGLFFPHDKGVIFPPTEEPGVLVFPPTVKRGIFSQGLFFPPTRRGGYFSPNRRVVSELSKYQSSGGRIRKTPSWDELWSRTALLHQQPRGRVILPSSKQTSSCLQAVSVE